MVNRQNQILVRSYMSEMMTLENQLETLISHLTPAVAIQPQVADAFDRYQRTVRTHRTALDARAHVIGNQKLEAPKVMLAIPMPTAVLPFEHGVSQALHVLYTAFNHVAFGYSMLHVVASHAFDSEGSDNTEDLAEMHLRDYAVAIQEMNQLISEVLVWELTQLKYECQCGCPACGSGMCMCSPHGTITLNQVWSETRPSEPAGGLWVRQPRSDSAAAQAGLRQGDRILSIDKQAIASDWDVPTLQNGILRHQSGEAIQLCVQRTTGEVEEITLIRP